MAEGSPRRNAHIHISAIAFFLEKPASIKIRVSSSSMEMREEKAAKERARKNSARKKEPAGIVENSFGIQMKVKPSLLDCMTSITLSWEKFWLAKTEKTVGIMATAARSDAT